MRPEASPFRPGRPVPAELFTGRHREVEQLRGMVRASQRGIFKIGFVSGERGIGKSSLAMFARQLVERERVMGCHVFLGGARRLNEMLRQTFDRFLKEGVNQPWRDAVRKFFGDHVQEIGLLGITLKLDIQERDLAALRHDFVPAMKRLLEQVGKHKRSIFLILDDINGLSTSHEFANWLKSTVDEIATSPHSPNLCLLLVGPEERRYELIAQQPSLTRVFELIRLAPWSSEETALFYRNSFQSAGAETTAEGLRSLVRFAGGLPVLAHEIGDAVWRRAEGPKIQRREVLAGITLAAEVVGAKWLEPKVFQAIRSENYRAVLNKMPRHPQLNFRRAELRERLTPGERRVLDNFLRRMKELGALEEDPEVRGGYRFPSLLHRLAFALAGIRQR